MTHLPEINKLSFTMTMMIRSPSFSKLALLLASLVAYGLESAHAFTPVTPQLTTGVMMHMAATSSTTSFGVEIVSNEDRVLDVASFRNGLTNPEMMVKKAKDKRDSMDNTKEALDGLKMGLLIIGPAIGLATYADSRDLMLAGQNYALLGGIIGGALATNSYIGNGVHVPDIPEASNRIIVDFSEGLLRKMDVGFVAVSKEDDPTYQPSRGVMAAVDVQLRNSKDCVQGVRTVPNLPAHVHIKNMDVHSFMRRQGVGQALLDSIETYAKEQTDAQALTLEVDGSNLPAVNLYRKNGFKERENPSRLSKNMFMVKEL